jgi:pimeloyl-ACP methyl ester carboxylesterase
MIHRVGLSLRGLGSEITHTPFPLPLTDILCQTFRMRKLTVTICLSIAVLLGSAGSSSATNLSDFYSDNSISAELFKIDGTKVNLNTYLIKNPSDKIVLIFNHGTQSWKREQECRPNRIPVFIEALDGTKINENPILTFHLCSFSVGWGDAGDLTITRAKEIGRAVEFFSKIGVQTNKIFIFGQSRGGWSTLYFAAKNKTFPLGGIVAINPSICSKNYDKCSDIIEENIALFEKINVPGLIISHQKEKYSRARQRNFAKSVKTLKFISNFCNELPARRAHGAAYRDCGMELFNEVHDFIKSNGFKSVK